MGAKRTADLIPLCHPLPITKVSIDLHPDQELPGVRITAEVRTNGQTGVEMEALTAVSTACLTVYDMLKAVEAALPSDVAIFAAAVADWRVDHASEAKIGRASCRERV